MIISNRFFIPATNPPRSIIFDGSNDLGYVTLPNSSPFSSVSDFRIEGYVYSWANWATLFRNEHYSITINVNTGVIAFFDRAAGEAAQATLSTPTHNTFIFRCRRVASTGEISVEAWDTSGSNRVAQTQTVVTTAALNWHTTTADMFSIGGARDSDGSMYSFISAKCAWMRFFDSAGSYNSSVPSGSATGNMLSYEFEDNGNDSSSNAQHLTLSGSPSFENTP